MNRTTTDMTDATNITIMEVVTYETRVICASLFIVISIAGIFGNCLVIFSVLASTKLQTFTNMFVVNLSIADLIACLLMQLQCVVLFSKDSYPFSMVACGTIAFILCVSCGSSLYTLASIGLYRLILLQDSSRKRADRLQTWRCAVIWIGSIWGISILTNIVPPYTFGDEQFGYNEKYHLCGAQDHTGNSNHEIELAQVLFLFTIPFSVLMISYGMIYYNIRRHTANTIREMDGLNGTIERSNSIPLKKKSWKPKTSILSPSLSRRSSQNARQLLRRQITITKNMFYVVLAFLICATPYTICLVLPELNALLYVGVLFLLNSCINPILYGVKHPHFRQVFKPLLTCRWSSVPVKSNAFRVILELKITNYHPYRVDP